MGKKPKRFSTRQILATKQVEGFARNRGGRKGGVGVRLLRVGRGRKAGVTPKQGRPCPGWLEIAWAVAAGWQRFPRSSQGPRFADHGPDLRKAGAIGPRGFVGVGAVWRGMDSRRREGGEVGDLAFRLSAIGPRASPERRAARTVVGLL